MATALFLAKQGIPSVLVEKKSFPRDKICGDGLSGWVISMLRRIDPEILAKVQNHPAQLPSHGVRFYAPNMKSLAIPYFSAKYPDEPPGHVMRRTDFDQILYEAVKAQPLITLVENTEILKIESTKENIVAFGAEENQRFEAEMVVVATGAATKITGLPPKGLYNPKHHATGIRQYYSGIQGFHQGNFVDFYFLDELLPGYLWIFPLPDGLANVGAGVRTDVLKKKRISLKQVMERAIASTPGLMDRFENAKAVSPVSAWDLPLGSKKTRLSGNRLLVTGDAGFLIDPFTGEGVGNALWSGFAAAEHIVSARQAGRFDEDFNMRYDRFVYDKLWKELRNSSTIQHLIGYPGLFNLVMNRANRSSYLQKSITRMIDSIEERKKLGNPLWYLRVLIGK